MSILQLLRSYDLEIRIITFHILITLIQLATKKYSGAIQSKLVTQQRSIHHTNKLCTNITFHYTYAIILFLHYVMMLTPPYINLIGQLHF